MNENFPVLGVFIPPFLLSQARKKETFSLLVLVFPQQQ